MVHAQLYTNNALWSCVLVSVIDKRRQQSKWPVKWQKRWGCLLISTLKTTSKGTDENIEREVIESKMQ